MVPDLKEKSRVVGDLEARWPKKTVPTVGEAHEYVRVMRKDIGETNFFVRKENP